MEDENLKASERPGIQCREVKCRSLRMLRLASEVAAATVLQTEAKIRSDLASLGAFLTDKQDFHNRQANVIHSRNALFVACRGPWT